MTAKDILRDLVAINTIADKDNDLIMNYIEKHFADLGFNVERRKNHDMGKEVLTAKYGDDPACLLYTSPSPRDRPTSRMPSSA